MELGSYYIMADFVANSTIGLCTISTGVLRKDSTREWVYGGPSSTWAVVTDSVSNIGGSRLEDDVACNFAQYTFYGTGFDFRFRALTSNSPTINVTLNGTLFDCMHSLQAGATISTYGTGVCFTPCTGVLDQDACSTQVGSGFVVSCLPLDTYTLLLTDTSAATNFMRVCAIDIITPIHNPKDIGPMALQSTREIGSQAIGDSRVFEPVVTCKVNVVQT